MAEMNVVESNSIQIKSKLEKMKLGKREVLAVI
jgi:hypothetical protein